MMKRIKEYIVDRIQMWAILIISIVVFNMVLALYNVHVEIHFYATFITILLVVFYVIFVDYHYYSKKRRQLSIQDSPEIFRVLLPNTHYYNEKEYQAIIQQLVEKGTSIVNDKNRMQVEMNEYYAMWAHQIKTPIAAMQLTLQTEQTNENEELLEQLFRIEQYVEIVLQYLRSETMSDDMVFDQYDLDDMLKQAIRKYSKSFIRKKISLVYNPINTTVLTDEKWLVFVLEQVLSNALKYTPVGEIKIYMDKNKEKTLVIEDTGIGIRDEDLYRVFEKGFTGYNGRQDKKSTGIGLYLCKRIINKLSHSIWIESEVGQGTKVFIDLHSVDLQTE